MKQTKRPRRRPIVRLYRQDPYHGCEHCYGPIHRTTVGPLCAKCTPLFTHHLNDLYQRLYPEASATVTRRFSPFMG